jgi:hypothetical protein
MAGVGIGGGPNPIEEILRRNSPQDDYMALEKAMFHLGLRQSWMRAGVFAGVAAVLVLAIRPRWATKPDGSAVWNPWDMDEDAAGRVPMPAIMLGAAFVGGVLL